MDIKEIEFLSCPFCAETQIKLMKWPAGATIWEIFCLNCKVTTGAKFTKKEAVIGWNARVNNHDKLMELLKDVLSEVNSCHDCIELSGDEELKERIKAVLEEPMHG